MRVYPRGGRRKRQTARWGLEKKGESIPENRDTQTLTERERDTRERQRQIERERRTQRKR